MIRVPQPPVNRELRDQENHGFRAGFAFALAAGTLLLVGAVRETGLPTTDGPPAREIQLMKAFASSGLEYADKIKPPPPPPEIDDPVANAEALARWVRERESAEPPLWKVRVDLSASAPCPT